MQDRPTTPNESRNFNDHLVAQSTKVPFGLSPTAIGAASPHRVRVYSRTYASAAPMRSLGVGKYPCILEQAYRDLKGKEAVATHAMGTHHEET